MTNPNYSAPSQDSGSDSGESSGENVETEENNKPSVETPTEGNTTPTPQT